MNDRAPLRAKRSASSLFRKSATGTADNARPKEAAIAAAIPSEAADESMTRPRSRAPRRIGTTAPRRTPADAAGVSHQSRRGSGRHARRRRRSRPESIRASTGETRNRHEELYSYTFPSLRAYRSPRRSSARLSLLFTVRRIRDLSSSNGRWSFPSAPFSIVTLPHLRPGGGNVPGYPGF